MPSLLAYSFALAKNIERWPGDMISRTRTACVSCEWRAVNARVKDGSKSLGTDRRCCSTSSILRSIPVPLRPSGTTAMQGTPTTFTSPSSPSTQRRSIPLEMRLPLPANVATHALACCDFFVARGDRKGSTSENAAPSIRTEKMTSELAPRRAGNLGEAAWVSSKFGPLIGLPLAPPKGRERSSLPTTSMASFHERHTPLAVTAHRRSTR